MSSLTAIERAVPWALRTVWIGIVLAGGEAIDAATAGRGSPAADVATVAGAAVWVAGVAAMAIPSLPGLTATRTIVPLAVPAAAALAIAGAGGEAGVLGALALLATVVAMTAELGRGFVQASAYGEENRFPLRPPPAYALAALVSWLVFAAAAIGAVVAFGGRVWVVGGSAAVVGVAVAVWSWPRWHRLSRRWLVVVPVGLVVHDHLVLAETVMIRRHEIGAVRLAPADTQAADLTGPAGGHTLEIATTESITAIYAGTPRQPGGSAIHLTAALVAPTRPGRALAAIAARRLPVGDR